MRIIGIGVLCAIALSAGAAAAAPQDVELARQVQQRLFADSRIRSDLILAQADNGHVTLSGVVETPSMKQAAAESTLAVAGVRSLDNSLAVAGETPSDAQLQASVTEAMNRSALTAGSTIVAHAAQGVVTLQGAVPSELARREASRLAQTVLGLRSLHNNLSVTNTQTADTPPGY